MNKEIKTSKPKRYLALSATFGVYIEKGGKYDESIFCFVDLTLIME